MLTQTVTGPRAWRATTIDERGAWYVSLPRDCRAALDETLAQLRSEPRPATELCVSDTPCGRCCADLRPVLDQLEKGRGFAIVEGLPCDRYSAAEQQAAYFLVGQLLGRPVAQNVQGTLLYDVRDTGQDVRYGA